MKWFAMLLLVIFFVPTMAYGQRVREEYVTKKDIEIRFPWATDPGADGWQDFDENVNVTEVNISYSEEPTSTTHKDKAKLGLQIWEFDLQRDMITNHEKCVIEFVLNFIPVGGRIMLIRTRVRENYSDGSGVEIGDFGETNQLKIIGKPGNLFKI